MIRLEDQGHAAAFHLGVALDLADEPQFLLDLDEDVPAELLVGHLTPAELQGELDFIALFEELAGVVDLDHQVVVADFDRAELDFLELSAARGGAGLVFLLLLLVPPLSVVDDFADGRARVGGDFDEVEPLLPCPA